MMDVWRQNLMDNQMKKVYKKPCMEEIVLRHRCALMQSSDNTPPISKDIGMAPLDNMSNG